MLLRIGPRTLYAELHPLKLIVPVTDSCQLTSEDGDGTLNITQAEIRLSFALDKHATLIFYLLHVIKAKTN